VEREDTTWRDEAACRDQDPDMFFPVGTTGEAVKAQIEVVKAFCAWCSVRINCLNYAVTNREEYGVWAVRLRRKEEL
jgi:WhiB family redox-sensing transcriptional regulator